MTIFIKVHIKGNPLHVNTALITSIGAFEGQTQIWVVGDPQHESGSIWPDESLEDMRGMFPQDMMFRP